MNYALAIQFIFVDIASFFPLMDMFVTFSGVYCTPAVCVVWVFRFVFCSSPVVHLDVQVAPVPLCGGVAI